ncbi:hypothetical protein ACFOLJ_04830 [Rugamonas sp. CCM 8940]|uniref:hypothetical protein n=1 Tax=Rugamonas sp. CCM 8940 TaxID=2765359 RepID=UPI0018F653D7|nr:hypothetical protein [Rugamonas sp. CCM 8940]MBJ7314166.1 hypothetical protein [Rugamonas sp. CCM 8940]
MMLIFIAGFRALALIVPSNNMRDGPGAAGHSSTPLNYSRADLDAEAKYTFQARRK